MRSVYRICRLLLLATAIWAWPSQALALDPALEASQYGHYAWRNRDGFGMGPVRALAQTKDGYIWIGTTNGLSRFDGVRRTSWHPPGGQQLPSNDIRALLGAHDGTLWIGTLQGLASWDGRKLIKYHALGTPVVNALAEGSEGTIWVATQSVTAAFVCAVRRGSASCHIADRGPGAFAIVFQDNSDGNLWVGTNSGLWRWSLGRQELIGRIRSVGVQPIAPGERGPIIILTDGTLRQVIAGRIRPIAVNVPKGTKLIAALADRDGGLWLSAQTDGLLHYHLGRLDSFRRSDGLSDDRVNCLFEDREGDVWVGTESGLDQFHAISVVNFSESQGIFGPPNSVLADRDGSIWMSGLRLYRWKNGVTSVYAARRHSEAFRPNMLRQAATIREFVVKNLPDGVHTLFQDRNGRVWLGGGRPDSPFGYIDGGNFIALNNVPHGFTDAITSDSKGSLWVGQRDAGLLRISEDVPARSTILVEARGRRQNYRLAYDPGRKGIWRASLFGRIDLIKDDTVRTSYVAPTAHGTGFLNDVRLTQDRAIWASTDSGLSRIKGGRIATLNSQSGLPCDAVLSSLVGKYGNTWIYTACGLVRITNRNLQAWAMSIDHGLRPGPIPMQIFDASDGIQSLGSLSGSPTPKMTQARDGKVWFPTADGVSVVDPFHLASNFVVPPVHIEQIVADRKTYDPSSAIQLPAQIRDLEIDFTALSFVAPEKMQFRYRLEGRDRTWQEAGNRRQAFYTDLAPGKYRFRVIAANNSGVWNRGGATLEFSIAPAFWQTRWFLALIALALFLSFAAIYEMRVMQLKRRAALARESDDRQREMLTQLARANRLATMGQLTASIAHEVKNPIAAAVTNAQAALRWLAAKPPNLDEARDALGGVADAGRSASDVIDRIRAFVKNQPPKKEALDVNEKIRSVLVLTHNEAAKNGVEVTTELAPDLPAVEGDRVQIQQVLLNLIMNAIEAMASVDGGQRELLIQSGHAEPGWVAVEVRDTGAGLPPDGIEALFDAFYTTKPTGLGMGLSISRSIVEAHGGKLTVKENVPHGAIFRFSIPAINDAQN
jgi:signal transduction histidine kinase/ligand-binding sensor domain-containing protein